MTAPRWISTVGVFAAMAGGLVVGSPTLVVGTPLIWVAWRHWSAFARRRSETERLSAELPPFIDGLVQQLKAGRSLATVLRAGVGPAAEGPVSVHLRPVESALAAGFRLEAALARIEHSQPPGIDLVVNTLLTLVRRGGPAVPSLERLNDTLRSAQWVDLEVRAQAAQATASAGALAGLPVVFIVGLGLIDGRLARFYLYNPIGAICLITAGLLSYLGWWWMQHLIASR